MSSLTPIFIFAKDMFTDNFWNTGNKKTYNSKALVEVPVPNLAQNQGSHLLLIDIVL